MLLRSQQIKLVLNGSLANRAVLKLDRVTFTGASHTVSSIELMNNWEIAQFDDVTFNAESVSYTEPDGEGGTITKYRNKESTFIKTLGCANSRISTSSWSNVLFNFTNGATYSPGLGYSLDFSACPSTVAPTTVNISGPSVVDRANSLGTSGIFNWIP
jgi:hypothetical protein